MWNLLFEVKTPLALLSHERNADLDTPVSLDNSAIGVDTGDNIRLTIDCLNSSVYFLLISNHSFRV